ncbi:MAG: ferredoxin [Pseudomonadota bacterium]
MAPTGARVLCLLGPDGPAMWQVFRESPEHLDGGAHPLDRWSHRVIEALAGTMGATALFPFGGPPWQPFQRWAARGEGAVQSPVGLQVTGRRGLWASYRGALAFFEDFDIPEPEDSQPCLDCPAPCLSACPIGAFADGRYDVASCVDFTDHAAGTACRSGCRARVSCPHGTGLNLPEAQREFHMTAFRNANRV